MTYRVGALDPAELGGALVRREQPSVSVKLHAPDESFFLSVRRKRLVTTVAKMSEYEQNMSET